jgi:hypothetical protein
MNHTGQWFNRQDIYDNMHDFLNELVAKEELREEQDMDIIYEAVMDSSTTHFDEPAKALAYPMIWSFIISYAEERIKYRKNLVYPRKYLRVAKSVFFKRQES